MAALAFLGTVQLQRFVASAAMCKNQYACAHFKPPVCMCSFYMEAVQCSGDWSTAIAATQQWQYITTRVNSLKCSAHPLFALANAHCIVEPPGPAQEPRDVRNREQPLASLHVFRILHVRPAESPGVDFERRHSPVACTPIIPLRENMQ